MVALPTEILPLIGIPVIFEPSPKKALAHTLLLTWTFPFTVTFPPRHTFPSTSRVPPIVVLPLTLTVLRNPAAPLTVAVECRTVAPVILVVPLT